MSTLHCLTYFDNASMPRAFRLRSLAWFIMAAVGTTPVWAAPLASPPAADPGSVDFNDAFTNTSHGSVDVSRFKKGNPVLPGTYRVDIFLNEMRVDRGDIVFRSVEGSDVAQPCFSPAMLSRFGVDMLKLDSSIGEEKSDCITMRNISADAMAEMDVGTLRLNLSIPQDSLIQRARGYVNPELWDQGETALLASYNVNVHSVDQTFSSRANVFGTAVGIDGLPISVRDGTRYSLGSDGGYVANPNGGYMLRPDGTYAAVSPGGYLAPNRDGNGYNNVNAFLGVNLGLNAGGWRIRSFGTGQWDQRTGHTNWRNVNTTATHDISDWKAQITFGDGHTQGQVFDSAPYRGVTLYSDDRMLPDSQQGYAPVIRGMANTQARVEVRQNGNLLYEATVAPGPFTINDLYSTGYGGDLIVTVFEADGSMHTISVPFSAVPMLLRPGVSRWSITNGQYRTQTLQNNKPYYLEGTYQRGINNWLTLYGGVQTTYRALYKSYLGGMAFNTPVGAVGFDITNSHTNFVGGKNNSISGYSSRLSYSKVLPTAGTTFALATYRYSNRGFLSLDDAVARQDYGTTIGSPEGLMNLPRTKQRLQITLNQNLGEGSKYGSLYFNGSRYSYWNDNADATTYMLGYSQSIRRVNFGITASRSYSSSRIFHGSRFDNQFGLNISVPLGSQLGAPTFMFNGTHDDVYGNTDRATVSGAFGDHRQFNYNGGVSYSNNRTTTTSTVNGGLGWRAAYGSLGANYSHARNYRQASANLSGGLVAHPGGITLAPQLSFDDPIAVVEAADAQGARVASSGTARIDGRGYAIATGLLPYRMNDVTLDPAGSSMNVELQTTRLQTAPRAGAVVPLKFNTVKGRAVLIRATQPNGEALPFGADVLDANGQNVGIVGQGGQMFVRSAESGGMLAVRWGDQPHQACHLRYELPARSTSQANTTIENAEGRCE